jgi:CheY-like chemotaxis protein/integral membrane sensor domain MASE1
MNECAQVAPTSDAKIWVARTIAIAAAYYAVAQFSRVLSLPPDLPSAIWPAAGISLASVLIWGNLGLIGVFLGAWATNGISTINPDATVLATLVGLGMASGATLQAWTGAAIIRRCVGYPVALLNGREICKFFVCSGPLNCVVGATVGVTTLWLSGYISPDRVAFNWFTWWVGDSIGTILAAPIMFMLFTKSPSIWRNRRTTVGAPLCVCLLGVTLAFLSAKGWQTDREYLTLIQKAGAINGKVDRAIQQNVDILRSVVGLYAASDQVTSVEFSAFAEPTATERRGLQALEWVPLVLAKDRAAWEQDMSRSGQPMRLMKVRANETDLELLCEIETRLPESLMLDPVRIRQILVNLLGNALKFTNSGYVKLAVSLLDIDSDPRLQLKVSDSGIGMTAAQMGRIFQPFAQADGSTSPEFGGTGLGLTISRNLARMLGGDIKVKSDLGCGSQFTVNVAAGGITAETQWLTKAEHFLSQSSHAPVPRVEHTSIGGRVLLAEDGPDNQRLISFLLRKANVDVTLVENGREAVDAAMAEDSRFDVIVMDMQMPVLDGYGAVRELRSRNYTGPILALTANAMSGDREKCSDAGCDGYTTKPIDRDELLSLVASYVPRSVTST